MHVLVTGGSGYVGSVVCERLARNFDVTNFDRNPPNHDNARFIRGDILNTAHLMHAMEGVDAVVHLAAIPHPNNDPADAVMEANVIGTERVVATAAHTSPTRLVAASSDSVFGFVFGAGRILPDYVPVDEQHPATPADSYGLSKLLGEEICKRYTRAAGLQTVCLRYCWVWNDDHYANLSAMMESPEMFVGQLWGYIDVRDVARAVEKAITAPDISHETLLIAADRTFQKLPTKQLIAQYLGETTQIRDEAWFADRPRRAIFDTSRAKAAIGFEPQYDCWDEAGMVA